MNLITKFRETVISVIPVMLIVLLLGLTIVPLDKLLLVRFVIGGLLLIAGLTIFLMGVDIGIQPMGERCGAELTKKRNLPLLLIVAFIIGFIVTVAEPDIQVFSDQVKNIYSFVNKITFTLVIACGVGFFILIGLLRSVLNFSVKMTLFICYTVVFLFSLFVPQSFIGIAFDSGGATTGPMTVPFIMALGLGVASVRSSSNNSDSFGLTGVTSVGPVFAVLIYALIVSSNQENFLQNNLTDLQISLQGAETTLQAGLLAQIFMPFSNIFSIVIHETLISIVPLLVLFIIFQITLLKMTRIQVIKIVIGFVYSLAGLTVFLLGVKGGFSQAGAALGEQLGFYVLTKGRHWLVILIITGLLLGAIIVCAEPAVWVLSEQVEQVSGGTIKRKVLLLFLSVGTAIAIALALWRAIEGFSLKIILIPGYIIAMILMLFSPKTFTGIAFDSGGVASGPLTSTFVLSFTIGAANSASSNADSFGVIALVAMMPLIAIQLMGIIFNRKKRKNITEVNA